MKKKELFVANCSILALVLIAGLVTFGLIANQGIRSILGIEKDKFMQKKTEVAAIEKATCSVKSALTIDGYDSNLTKLEEYQSICNSFVTDKLMIFTGFPDPDSAISDSTEMALKLKKFSSNKVTPIVVAEPYVGTGLLNYKTFLNGDYDIALDQYFSNLLELGVTDEMMGTWAPFPESNTPSWDNKDAEPEDFALAVNKYLSALQKYFPKAKGSVLLSAITYEPNDLDWANGDYLNLTPYLQNIDKNLVSSFGIQGFPWVSDATTKKRQIFRASEFIQPDLAISAAQELRTKDIWINTGSFSSKYTLDSKKTVQVSLNERKGILNGILEEVKKIQSYQLNEYRVSINLFAEDKSTNDEATDWSYFQNDDSKELFKEFLIKSEDLGIPVSLYDEMNGSKKSRLY